MLKAVYISSGLKVNGEFILSTIPNTTSSIPSTSTSLHMINFALLTSTYVKVRARGFYIIVNRAENVINIVRSLSVVKFKNI